MAQPKFIFTGTPGVGKTTAIEAISEVPLIKTEVPTTDALAARKATTTVAMDYGEFSLDDGQKIRLYGTPGQKRFEFMWRILIDGGLGLIILVDNSRDDPLADLSTYLEDFGDYIDQTAAVVGITRLGDHPAPTLDEYVELMAQKGQIHPVFEVDIRQTDDVLLLIDALLSCLEEAA